MNYCPHGTVLKDTWYFVDGEEVHCLHMQQANLENRGDTRQFCIIGHAFTKDLISWRPLPPALVGGLPGSYDDARLHTGCVVEKGGVYHLFHTATSSRQRGGNRIALATSTDAIHWIKHPGNPILAPDPRWYYSHDSVIPLRCHGWPIVDCRDPVVVPDPEGDRYWMFFAARRHGTQCAETSVIALAHSHDLIHWEQHPPCFAPDRYACVEVPEVFCLDGRWYMLCLTGNGYGQRHVMAEPNLTRGTIYAVADRLEGPYHEPDDNVLMGTASRGGSAARVVGWAGAHHLLATNPPGTISLPSILRMDTAGKLRPYYFTGLDAHRGERLIAKTSAPGLPNDGRWGSIGEWRTTAGVIAGRCRTDWAMHVFEPVGDDFIFEADICLRDARAAGLVFRLQGDDVSGGCYAAILDADAGEVILTRPRHFATMDHRRVAVHRNRPYRMRCVGAGPMVYVYVDDVLWLQTYLPEGTAGRFGLLVDRGEAEFSRVAAAGLTTSYGSLNGTPDDSCSVQNRRDHDEPSGAA